MSSYPESQDWVDTHGDSLYSFAYFKTRDTELAQDVVEWIGRAYSPARRLIDSSLDF